MSPTLQKKWVFIPYNDTQVIALQKQLHVSSILCKLLVQRSIFDYDTAKKFFRPCLTDLHNPWKMKDMHKAVNRIEIAIQKQEKILVYGDYDVDGTTAVTCMYHFLQSIYKKEFIGYYIPDRQKEGYGVSKQGINFAKDNGYSLIIILDCGIKNREEIRYASSLYIDCIICDHHLPPEEIPDASAVLNPKQIDCLYPFKELCGCGVTWKLIQALCETKQLPKKTYLQYIDLVATAIAADIVPMIDENRILVAFGLKKINKIADSSFEDTPIFPFGGLPQLIQSTGINIPLETYHLVFMLAPRINATGRMDTAYKVVTMLLNENNQTTQLHIQAIEHDNQQRKTIDEHITNTALDMIQQDTHFSNMKTTVLYHPTWHKGVVGIVASRLIEKYYQPTIILAEEGDILSGSARSIEGLNLYEALFACKEYLIRFGGHVAAAGLSLYKKDFIPFKEKFDSFVQAIAPSSIWIPKIYISSTILFSDITMSLYHLIAQLSPFGPNNLKPIFHSIAVTLTQVTLLKEKHIKAIWTQQECAFSSITFQSPQWIDKLKPHEVYDIVYQIDINYWMGETTLQLRVLDFIPHHVYEADKNF